MLEEKAEQYNTLQMHYETNKNFRNYVKNIDKSFIIIWVKSIYV